MAKAIPVAVVAPIVIAGKSGGVNASEAYSLSGWAKKHAYATGVVTGEVSREHTVEFTYQGKQYIYHKRWDNAAQKFCVKREWELLKYFRFHGR